MGLKIYRTKRDFKHTPEPRGKTKTSFQKKIPFFVIQKHAARRLHYDFRLEMAGVLKSWAVPKGFPLKRCEKHLAIHVEDHPLEYAKFEGVIPPGNYGGGTVMLWDIGTYEVLHCDPLSALKKGKIEFTLHGKKLEGLWTLIRTQAIRGTKDAWLLLKNVENAKPLTLKAQNTSVLTRRSMEEIADTQEAICQNNKKKSRPILR